jgi:hypothetical protein
MENNIELSAAEQTQFVLLVTKALATCPAKHRPKILEERNVLIFAILETFLQGFPADDPVRKRWEIGLATACAALYVHLGSPHTH